LALPLEALDNFALKRELDQIGETVSHVTHGR
jgi:hypothetical protein